MSKAKNDTLYLPTELSNKDEIYVKQKYIPSEKAAVKEALEEYSKRIEKEMLKREMIRAANDPFFLNDLMENMRTFEFIDVS